MITGTTALLAHIGWPTHAFKAPMIYNPYFERACIDAVVVQMGCREDNYPAFLRYAFRAGLTGRTTVRCSFGIRSTRPPSRTAST